MKFRITQRSLYFNNFAQNWVLHYFELHITESFTLLRALHYSVFYITTSFTLLRAPHYLTLLRVLHYLSLHYLVLRSGYIAALNSTVSIQIYTPVLLLVARRGKTSLPLPGRRRRRRLRWRLVQSGKVKERKVALSSLSSFLFSLYYLWYFWFILYF